jgi:hypothetical protein
MTNPRPKHPITETVPMVVMLRRDLRNALLAHCRVSGESPHDVVSDAVALLIDEPVEVGPPGLWPFAPELRAAE